MLGMPGVPRFPMRNPLALEKVLFQFVSLEVDCIILIGF